MRTTTHFGTSRKSPRHVGGVHLPQLGRGDVFSVACRLYSLTLRSGLRHHSIVRARDPLG